MHSLVKRAPTNGDLGCSGSEWKLILGDAPSPGQLSRNKKGSRVLDVDARCVLSLERNSHTQDGPASRESTETDRIGPVQDGPAR